MSIFTLFVVICCLSVQLVCANLANPATALNLATGAATVMAETPPTPTPSTPVNEIPHAWKNLTSHPTAPASEIPPAWTNLTSYPTAPASEIPPAKHCPSLGWLLSTV